MPVLLIKIIDMLGISKQTWLDKLVDKLVKRGKMSCRPNHTNQMICADVPGNPLLYFQITCRPTCTVLFWVPLWSMLWFSLSVSIFHDRLFDIIDWKINKNHCNLPIKIYLIKAKFLPSSWTEPAGQIEAVFPWWQIKNSKTDQCNASMAFAHETCRPMSVQKLQQVNIS